MLTCPVCAPPAKQNRAGFQQVQAPTSACRFFLIGAVAYYLNVIHTSSKLTGTLRVPSLANTHSSTIRVSSLANTHSSPCSLACVPSCSINYSHLHVLNRCLMNLFRVEEMWELLRSSFLECGQLKGPSVSGNIVPSKHLNLDLRGLTTLLDNFGMLSSDETIRQIYQEATHEGSCKVTPESLLVYSAIFQNLVLKEDRGNAIRLPVSESRSECTMCGTLCFAYGLHAIADQCLK
jgi:hypothetical protein